VLVPLIGMCAAPAMLLASSTNVLPLALGGLMVFGLTKSFADANMMPILTLVSDKRYRATGYGVLNLCARVVGGITIYAGGALRDAKIDVSNVFHFGAGEHRGMCSAVVFREVEGNARNVNALAVITRIVGMIWFLGVGLAMPSGAEIALQEKVRDLGGAAGAVCADGRRRDFQGRRARWVGFPG